VSDAAYACARWLTLALLALLPLIVWPGLAQPFSIPKFFAIFGATWLIIAHTVLGRFARMLRGLSDLEPSRRWPSDVAWLVFPWFASWGLSTAVGDLSHGMGIAFAFVSAMFALCIATIDLTPVRIASAMVVGATALASIALAQAFGADPFAFFGWMPPIERGSLRLRVYGTLGNPDFVAALLTATTPLTVSLLVRARNRGSSTLAAGLGGALVLQLAAIIATGSRAGALGLFAAAMTWAAMARGHRRARMAIAATGAAIALIAIIVSTARPLTQTIAGRAYIVSIAAPHALDAPFVGHGPGSFEILYDEWEQQARLGRASRPAFAGPQQHAHNDFLEAVIERGLVGLVTIVVLFATSFRNAWRLTRRTRTHDASIILGAAAMLTALAAMACVDFPLARPTELTWFWSGVVMIILSNREVSGDADGGTLDDIARVGSHGPDNRAGPRHDRRGDPRRPDEVLGKT
jgi:putative inorganic carbon (HCO3(-)) transporter